MAKPFRFAVENGEHLAAVEKSDQVIAQAKAEWMAELINEINQLPLSEEFKEQARGGVVVAAGRMEAKARGDAVKDDDLDDAVKSNELTAFREWVEKRAGDTSAATEEQPMTAMSLRRKPFRMSLDQARAAVAAGVRFDLSGQSPEALQKQTRLALASGDAPLLYSVYKAGEPERADKIVDELFRRRKQTTQEVA